MKHEIKKWNEEKKGKDIVEVNITPVQAIHYFCVNECMAGQPDLVSGCTDPNCPLYPYRMNKNPGKVLCGESRENVVRQLAINRQKRKKQRANS